MKKIEIKNRIIGEGIPKICVPIVGRTEEDILEQAKKIAECKARIDVVEFRADYYEKLQDINQLIALLKNIREILADKALLFTIRTESEGGEKLPFATPNVFDINYAVIDSAIPDMIDVELSSGESDIEKLVEFAHKKGVYVIMSNHDFKSTPEYDDMLKRLCSMQDMGADIAKLAVMPQNEMDLIRLLNVTLDMKNNYADIPVVTISMGKCGSLSRITGQIFGSAMTFAALDNSSAPGQIPVDELEKIMNSLEAYCVR